MQITIYVDDELVQALDRRAREQKVSRSRMVQRLLRAGLVGRRPERLLAAFGSIPDLTDDARAHLGPDSLRQAFS